MGCVGWLMKEKKRYGNSLISDQSRSENKRGSVSSFLSKKNKELRGAKKKNESKIRNDTKSHQVRGSFESNARIDDQFTEDILGHGDDLLQKSSEDQNWEMPSGHFRKLQTKNSIKELQNRLKESGQILAKKEVSNKREFQESEDLISPQFEKIEATLQSLERAFFQMKKENDLSRLLKKLSKPSDFLNEASDLSNESSGSFDHYSSFSNITGENDLYEEDLVLEDSDLLVETSHQEQEEKHLVFKQEDSFGEHFSFSDSSDNVDEFLEEDDYFDEYENDDSIDVLREKVLTTTDSNVGETCIQELYDKIQEDGNELALQALKEIYESYHDESKHLRKKPRSSDFPSLTALAKEVNRRKQALRNNPRRSVTKIFVKLFEREEKIRNELIKNAQNMSDSIEMQIIDEVARGKIRKIKETIDKIPSDQATATFIIQQNILEALEIVVKFLKRADPILTRRILGRLGRSFEKLFMAMLSLQQLELKQLMDSFSSSIQFLEDGNKVLLGEAIMRGFKKIKSNTHNERNKKFLENSFIKIFRVHKIS